VKVKDRFKERGLVRKIERLLLLTFRLFYS